MTESERQIKCEQILREILRLINSKEDALFSFKYDLGEDTAKIYWDEAHTHVGVPGEPSDETWDMFVQTLHSQLTGGPGLSWFRPSICQGEGN